MIARLYRRPDEEHESAVALPPVPVLRQRVRGAARDLAVAPSGRRAAALSALWIAVTGCEDGLAGYEPRFALQTYRLIESDLRAELRIVLGNAIASEAEPGTRATMLTMLELIEELEAYAVAPRAVKRRTAA